MKRFIKALRLENTQNTYIYSVLPCGDDYEGAVEHIRCSLAKIYLPLHGDYTIIMPNNYVIGHELDEDDIVASKLSSSRSSIEIIAQSVLAKDINSFCVT